MAAVTSGNNKHVGVVQFGHESEILFNAIMGSLGVFDLTPSWFYVKQLLRVPRKGPTLARMFVPAENPKRVGE